MRTWRAKAKQFIDSHDLPCRISSLAIKCISPPTRGLEGVTRLSQPIDAPMPQVLDWQNAADPRDIVRRAVEALSAGQIVAFPTETVYGLAASALVPEAVERLQQSKGRPENKPLTLAVPDPAGAREMVPDMSPLGWRLARRCWPGPVTLVFADSKPSGLASSLPAAVRQRICPSGTLGLRVPAHEAILEVMRLLQGPLVLTSANRSGAAAGNDGRGSMSSGWRRCCSHHRRRAESFRQGLDRSSGKQRRVERAAGGGGFGGRSAPAGRLPDCVRLHRQYLP